MQLTITLGQDVSSYAEMKMEVPDGTTEKELTAVLQGMLVNDEFDAMPFNEDRSTASSLRIVTALDQDGNFIAEDVPLEACPFDAGQILQLWLMGHSGSLLSVIESSAWARLIPELKMEVHRGTFTLPGMESIEVEFEARVGATQEEKDLAFFKALSDVGRVDHLAIGQIKSQP